nr:hypothetical protein BaRGS_010807 [Batillaria attramentaria]
MKAAGERECVNVAFEILDVDNMTSDGEPDAVELVDVMTFHFALGQPSQLNFTPKNLTGERAYLPSAESGGEFFILAGHQSQHASRHNHDHRVRLGDRSIADNDAGDDNSNDNTDANNADDDNSNDYSAIQQYGQ